MSLSSTRRLGGTVVAGPASSGTVYASCVLPRPHTTCWMELAVFAAFPRVPSLAGTRIQGREDLLASTRGAGDVVCGPVLLEFELFDDEAPMACANFRRLCCGQTTSRQSQTYCYAGLTASYRGTYFHKIFPRFAAQGGDLTMRVDGGANHFSSAGKGWFADESKRRRHNEVGLLSMANNGPNSNGSQFFIVTAADQERAFNGRHVCFGRVTKGLAEFMRDVAPYGNCQGHPARYAVVVDCGDGPLPALGTTLAASQDGNEAAEEQEGEEVQLKVKEEEEEAKAQSAEAPAATTTAAALKSSLKRPGAAGTAAAKHVTYVM